MNKENQITQQELDKVVGLYNGTSKPEAGEVGAPEVCANVTEEDIRIAAAAGLQCPAGATPEQRENFEKLRKIAMAKSCK